MRWWRHCHGSHLRELQDVLVQNATTLKVTKAIDFYYFPVLADFECEGDGLLAAYLVPGLVCGLGHSVLLSCSSVIHGHTVLYTDN